MKKLSILFALALLTSCGNPDASTPDMNPEEPVQNVSTQETTEEVSETPDSGMISGDYTSADEMYTLFIPDSYYLEQETASYTRIQNYVATDAPTLSEGNYYLEISTGNTSELEACEDRVQNAETQDFGNASGLIGDGLGGGDAGGARKAVCIDKDGTNYFFQAVGNGTGEDAVQEILNSIDFL